MKLYNTKKIQLIIIAIFAGIILSAFLLREQRGLLGEIEIYILILTSIVALTIFAIILKKGNK